MNKNWSTIQHIDSDSWDNYVGTHPCGHHEQTSRFASIRAMNHYRSARIGIADGNGQLVAGVQVLYRNLPIVGRIALISQGPLVSQNRSDIAKALIQQLDQLAASLRITRIRVVNYSEDDFWAPLLIESGFERCGNRWAPGGTVLVSCDQDDDAILANMKKQCRYNLRLAKRKGVTATTTGEEGLETFYELLRQTAQRQVFPFLPFDYYKRTWQIFAPNNRLHLIISSADNEPLSCVVMTVLGNRAYYGWGGMSPNRPKLMANYVSHWEAIQLARGLGCKYYDLSGGADGDDGVSQFKRRWSNNVVEYPDPFDKYYGPLRDLRRNGTHFVWDHERLRDWSYKIDYRLRGGRMPF